MRNGLRRTLQCLSGRRALSFLTVLRPARRQLPFAEDSGSVSALCRPCFHRWIESGGPGQGVPRVLGSCAAAAGSGIDPARLVSPSESS